MTAGVPDAAKASLLAAIASSRPHPALIIVPRLSQAQALVEELEAWADPRVDVRLFPQRDSLFYEYITPPADIVHERLSVLSELQSGRPRLVIVSSIRAAAQPTIEPAALLESKLTVRRGDLVKLDQFLRRLDSLGYQIEALVDRPGVVSRRGGIIDVFPVQLDEPIRIELFGDEVESLRRFDTATQRSLGEVDSFEVTTARELGHSERVARDLAKALDFESTEATAEERWRNDLATLQSGDWFPQEACYTSFLARGNILDFVPREALLVLDEASEIERRLDDLEEQAVQAREESEERGEIPRGLPLPLTPWSALISLASGHHRQLHFSRWTTGEEGGGFIRGPFTAAPIYGGSLRTMIDGAEKMAAEKRRVIVVSQQAQRIAELFREEGRDVEAVAGVRQLPAPARTSVVQGSLGQGWILNDDAGSAVLITDAEIFGFRKQRRALPRRRSSALADAVLPELRAGDFVVHIDHGIARFGGTVRRRLDNRETEYLELYFADGDKLYVPVDQADRVGRYVGPGDFTPVLTRLGTQDWQRAKERVRRVVADLAQELLELYASRELAQGYAFVNDNPWLMELEASFPYVETPDQLAAINAVKEDMERVRPMDRLVCGDVGYGKTEVAIRAAFQAVLNGKQVAVLVPTTVLAQQHFNTFSERLAGFP
ncbi:MAG: DEAD/DEAH box helicase, partial [Dehalococcoidia bacterium]|nr:DEAD/DEAH box helicase [Dehalococcoidia bacterium]